MTDQVSISELPLSQPLTGNEVLPMDQGPSTVQATAQQIANLAPKTDLGYVPATRTLTSSTGEDIEIPEVSATASGLLPAAWISGTSPALFPHIHGSLAGTVYEHVKAGASLSALTPYRIIGGVGDTDRVEVVAADASNSNTMPASGILPSALASNADGHGTVAGVITGVNTAAYPPGTVLYVAVGGGLTATRPSANVQMVAVVGRQHASTGTVVPLISPSLALSAYTGSYGDLIGLPTLGTAAAAATTDFAPASQGVTNGNSHNHDGGDGAQIPYSSLSDLPTLGGAAALSVGTAAGTVAAGDDSRFSDTREWTAATVDQAEAESGTATTRRAWTAERVRQAIAAWWTGASTAAGRLLVTAVDAAAQRTALALSSADSPQFTGVGLGIAPRTGYAAALGAGVIPRGAVVTAVGSTYSCDIRAASRFLLSAAIAGNTTIEFINLGDLVVSGGIVPYVEFQLDFLYTSGVITLTGAGFTTKWDGNAAITPDAGEFEQLIIQITPAITGTPFTTPTVKVAAMRGNV